MFVGWFSGCEAKLQEVVSWCVRPGRRGVVAREIRTRLLWRAFVIAAFSEDGRRGGTERN